MRILVTGAEGFVGSEIVAEFQKEKFEVFRLNSLKSKNSNNSEYLLRADITNFESLKKPEELKKIDVVVHAAGLAHQFGEISKEDFWKVNVEGTKNVALLAAKLSAKHMILISSVAVYGRAGKQKGRAVVDEDSGCEPESLYAQSKLEAELAATKICEEHKLPLTILRLATVIGEDDPGNTSRLIKAIDKKRFVWLGKGENYKSLIYKTDVAKACQSVLDKKSSEREVFNVTAGPVSMKAIVSEIERHLDKKIPGIYVPEKLLKIAFAANEKLFRLKRIIKLSETVEKWLSEDVFSGEKIALKYRFRAETPVAEAIQRQVESYKSQR
ncbi:MAG TPA: NAD-dependent epimerase/dehydratase family protein [Pyrinomonadaceae bacterium]|jgi:nucleoside-diphosphate-sugar epimerase